MPVNFTSFVGKEGVVYRDMGDYIQKTGHSYFLLPKETAFFSRSIDYPNNTTDFTFFIPNTEDFLLYRIDIQYRYASVFNNFVFLGADVLSDFEVISFYRKTYYSSSNSNPDVYTNIYSDISSFRLFAFNRTVSTYYLTVDKTNNNLFLYGYCILGPSVSEFVLYEIWSVVYDYVYSEFRGFSSIYTLDPYDSFTANIFIQLLSNLSYKAFDVGSHQPTKYV